jgi:hypothetical protein
VGELTHAGGRGANAGGGSDYIGGLMSAIGKAMPAIKTAVGLTQILSGMSFAFSLEFPDTFTRLLTQLKVCQLDVTSLFKMGCLAEWNFVDNFYLSISMMPLLCSVMLVIFKVRAWRLEKKLAADAETRTSGAIAAEVSRFCRFCRFCACIGSPCLRHGVLGAPIGGPAAGSARAHAGHHLHLRVPALPVRASDHPPTSVRKPCTAVWTGAAAGHTPGAWTAQLTSSLTAQLTAQLIL